MVDIHTHILWDLDDGAGTKDESLAMLAMAAQSGTSAIVATPHKDSRFPYDVGTVEARITELQAAVARPRIYRGCDFHLSLENIAEALEHPFEYTINRGPYLLVEFADTFIPPTAENIFRQFVERGVIPVITHPERNPILSQAFELLERWVNLGCLLQITGQSLTDRFGRNARTAAWSLVRKGLVHVVASDAHDTEHRPPRLDEARQILKREMNEEIAELLLDANPMAIVSGAPVARVSLPQGKTPRWTFWR